MRGALSKDCTDITRGDKLEEVETAFNFFKCWVWNIQEIYIQAKVIMWILLPRYDSLSSWKPWEMMTLPRWGKGKAWNWKKSKVSTILRPGHEKSRTTKQTEVLWDFKTSYNFTEV